MLRDAQLVLRRLRSSTTRSDCLTLYDLWARLIAESLRASGTRFDPLHTAVTASRCSTTSPERIGWTQLSDGERQRSVSCRSNSSIRCQPFAALTLVRTAR